MEYEIGQEIELIHDNKTIKLRIEKNDNCENCFFNEGYTFGKFLCTRNTYHLSDAYCSKIIRTDKTSIIYKQIK